MASKSSNGRSKPKPRRASTQEWESHREDIVNLYRHKPLKEVRELMSRTRGFEASESQYARQFNKWKVWKNKRPCDCPRGVEANHVPNLVAQSPGGFHTDLSATTPAQFRGWTPPLTYTQPPTFLDSRFLPSSTEAWGQGSDLTSISFPEYQPQARQIGSQTLAGRAGVNVWPPSARSVSDYLSIDGVRGSASGVDTYGAMHLGGTITPGLGGAYLGFNRPLLPGPEYDQHFLVSTPVQARGPPQTEFLSRPPMPLLNTRRG